MIWSLLLISGANIAVFAAFLKTTIAIALICFYTFPAIVTLAALFILRGVTIAFTHDVTGGSTQVGGIDEAIAIVNSGSYGNQACLFTTSGATGGNPCAFRSTYWAIIRSSFTSMSFVTRSAERLRTSRASDTMSPRRPKGRR